MLKDFFHAIRNVYLSEMFSSLENILWNNILYFKKHKMLQLYYASIHDWLGWLV